MLKRQQQIKTSLTVVYISNMKDCILSNEFEIVIIFSYK